MVRLRLKRYGKKRQPTYRVVAIEQKSRREARPLEELGFYNPRTKETNLETASVIKWIQNGAQPSDSLVGILKRAGVYDLIKAGVAGAEVEPIRIAPTPKPVPVVAVIAAVDPVEAEIPEPEIPTEEVETAELPVAEIPEPEIPAEVEAAEILVTDPVAEISAEAVEAEAPVEAEIPVVDPVAATELSASAEESTSDEETVAVAAE